MSFEQEAVYMKNRIQKVGGTVQVNGNYLIVDDAYIFCVTNSFYKRVDDTKYTDRGINNFLNLIKSRHS